MHQLPVPRWKFQVDPPRTALDLGYEALRISQVLDNVGCKNEIAAAVWHGQGVRIRLDDGDTGKPHRLIAVQTVVERILLYDEIGSPKGAMTTSDIDDKIAAADFNSAQDLVASHLRRT
jgi:hypothetical protein